MRIKEIDITNGVAGACALLTALVYRQQTGRGQRIDLSQLEAATTSLIGEHLLEYTLNGTQTLPLGNRHRQFAPHGCYQCKGEDKWIAIAIRSDEDWASFCKVIGRPELTSNSKFATSTSRLQNQLELDRVVEEWTVLHSHQDAMHLLQKARIPAGAVLNAAEVSEDRHLRARGFFRKAMDGSLSLFPGMPFLFREQNGDVRQRGPLLGEHNEYVICELLGRSIAEISPLTDDKIGTAFDVE